MKRRSFAWILAAAMVLPAQQPEPEPVFRATTQLVQFTFVALDKNGKPVTDLKKEELVIEDKGKSREIAFFRFEGGEAAAPVVKDKTPGVFSNRPESGGVPPRNLTAIVIDTLNTAPADAMWVKAQALRYLRVMAPDTRVAVYFLGRQIAVVHDFTDDMDSLREKLKSATLALPPITELDMKTVIAEAEALLRMADNDPILEAMLKEAIESDMLANESARRRRLDMTLSMLESLGRHLSGIPGRKNLVWIGGGLSMLSITGAMGFGAKGGVTSYEKQISDTSKRLAQQGITLYNVDSKGLTGNAGFNSSNSAMDTPGRRRAFGQQQQAETITADTQPAMVAMASITGGRMIINTNDPMDGAKLAANDMKAAYSVGFYMPDEPDGKWRSLKVKTKRPGVRISHQEGYLAEAVAAQPLAWTPEQWNSALLNPLGSSAVRLNGYCKAAPEPGTVEVSVQIDAQDLHFKRNPDSLAAFVEMGLAEKSATGVLGYQKGTGSIKLPADTVKLPPASANRYERKVKPRADAIALRLVVRDLLTGQYGTLDMGLKSCGGK